MNSGIAEWKHDSINETLTDNCVVRVGGRSRMLIDSAHLDSTPRNCFECGHQCENALLVIGEHKDLPHPV